MISRTRTTVSLLLVVASLPHDLHAVVLWRPIHGRLKLIPARFSATTIQSDA